MSSQTTQDPPPSGQDSSNNIQFFTPHQRLLVYQQMELVSDINALISDNKNISSQCRDVKVYPRGTEFNNYTIHVHTIHVDYSVSRDEWHDMGLSICRYMMDLALWPTIVFLPRRESGEGHGQPMIEKPVVLQRASGTTDIVCSLWYYCEPLPDYSDVDARWLAQNRGCPPRFQILGPEQSQLELQPQPQPSEPVFEPLQFDPVDQAFELVPSTSASMPIE